MKKLQTLTALLLALACLLSFASAETYSLGAGATFTCETYEEGEEISLTADRIMLLGADEDEKVVAYAAEQLIRLTREALGGISAQLGAAELPALSEIGTLERGDNSEEVQALQEALIALGYLEGTADGSFGSQTKHAVSAFQEAYNIPESGRADAVTRLLLQELTGSGAQEAPQSSEWIAWLAEKAGADLSAFEDKGLTFDYDDIAGTGFVGNGSSAVFQTGESTVDLDSYTYQLDFGFNVALDAKGAATVKPAVNVTNESVRRPMMQSIILKSGELRATIKVTSPAASLAGSLSREKGSFVLNADACALLAQCAEAGELKVRVGGKYESYDLEIPAELLGKISEIGAIGAQLLAA